MADLRLGEQGLQNFTDLMEIVPREHNQLEIMGLFDVDYSDTVQTSFERIYGGTDNMYSVARGADRQYAGDDQAKTAYLEIPFFTLDKVVKPSDAFALREFATATDPATVEGKVTRVISRIQRGHARLHKKVMYQALKGTTYAEDKDGNARPNLQRTFQSMFDIADADMYNATAGGAATVSLTDQTSNPADEFEKFRKHLFNKIGDNSDNFRVLAMVGSGAFSALKNHSSYVEAFANYASQEEPLRQRLGGLATARVLEWQGITYVEDISGEIGDTQIFLLPLGVEEMFQLQYGPADTVAAANGEEAVAEAYLYVKSDDRKVGVESEAAIVAVNTRDDLVARYTATI